MLFRIILILALLVGGSRIVSYIRSLVDDYNYKNQDVNSFIDRH